MLPATPVLLADVLRVTPAQVGIFAAVAAVTALGGNVMWEWLADRHSSLRALRVVYLVGITTPIIYALSRTPWMLVAASISESLLATGLDIVWMMVVIDFAGARRATQYAAISGTLAGVRGIVAPLVGALIIRVAGVHAVYLTAAGFMSCGAWLACHQVRHGAESRDFALAPGRAALERA